MQPAREDITTAAHVLTHELPLKLRKLYPIHARAMLQSLRVEELTVHGPQGTEQHIVLPRALGRFSRSAPAIPMEGLGDPLDEQASAYSLVLDYLHAPAAYGAADAIFGLRLRLRYNLDTDVLEGLCGYWPAAPSEDTAATRSRFPIHAVFHLSYTIPY